MEESGIRKVFALAAGNRGEYIDLSIGQPDFPVTADLKQAAAQAVQKDNNRYTPTQGLPELRQVIANKLQEENNIPARPEEVIITSGVSGALFLSLSALLDPGDEVIIPDPYFVMYKQLALFLGAKPVFWNTYPDFRPKPEKLEPLVTNRTKCLILNSPNNPTGAVYSRDELAQVADIARKHDLPIVSDEIYEKFDYDNRFVSPASFYANTITLNGFSKSHAVTGWRVGYAHADEGLVQAMNKLQQYSFVCAPAPAQSALAGEMDAYPREGCQAYARKRDILWQGLKDKYEIPRPEGAFYAFLKEPADRPDIWEELLERKLLTVPGRVFSESQGYIRLSFAAPDSDLETAVKILLRL